MQIRRSTINTSTRAQGSILANDQSSFLHTAGEHMIHTPTLDQKGGPRAHSHISARSRRHGATKTPVPQQRPETSNTLSSGYAHPNPPPPPLSSSTISNPFPSHFRSSVAFWSRVPTCTRKITQTWVFQVPPQCSSLSTLPSPKRNKSCN